MRREGAPAWRRPRSLLPTLGIRSEADPSPIIHHLQPPSSPKSCVRPLPSVLLNWLIYLQPKPHTPHSSLAANSNIALGRVQVRCDVEGPRFSYFGECFSRVSCMLAFHCK